jgi:NAD(P)-dependent dehydrogenase (short-subunit alcohol dehydrogenase family)
MNDSNRERSLRWGVGAGELAKLQEMTMPNPAPFDAGNCAVITGGASGIGLAAAKRFAAMGLNVVIADLPGEQLAKAASEVATISPNGAKSVLAAPTDVSQLAEVEALEKAATSAFGPVAVLMNNAGIGPARSILGDWEGWRRTIDVNLWGVIHGGKTFAPGMIASGRPATIVNTGSKQGITTPPGNPAYNISKAGMKVFTEALQHELRNVAGCKVTAHLLIPGFVFTSMTAGARTEKPAGAWTPEQTIDFMIDELRVGTFYILCPDNEVSHALDERRMAWAIGDVIENRPPLSRWHPDYADAFKKSVADL